MLDNSRHSITVLNLTVIPLQYYVKDAHLHYTIQWNAYISASCLAIMLFHFKAKYIVVAFLLKT